MARSSQVKSQESTVKKFKDEFDKLTKEVDNIFLTNGGNLEDPKLLDKMKMLSVVRNTLMEQEKKLIGMKNEKT